jgi:hypothetical protein
VTWAVADLPPAIGRRITVHPESGCWIVGGYHDRDGYAHIRGQGAHRAVWELLVGPIPAGLVADHREDRGCISKACCFPGHLLPVTQCVNSTRPGAGGVGAMNAAKTHCDHGHEFNLLTTYWKPDGHRDCRPCIRRRVSEYKARLREGRAKTRELARAA